MSNLSRFPNALAPVVFDKCIYLFMLVSMMYPPMHQCP